jgi:serine/threonine-protein kinase HipA
MAKNPIINVVCFGVEVGVLGWDENRRVSFFQYHPDFLSLNPIPNLIPQTGIIRPVKEVQVFKTFDSESFRGLPPIFADSLPDVFGNVIFKAWLESSQKDMGKISVLEQLAYVANRGMGAFEYQPAKELPSATTIRLDDMVQIVKQVMDLKSQTSAQKLNHESLMNIFKIGTSAGGARPKILVSERKSDGQIFPGDVHLSEDFDHYLVKLNLGDEWGYNRELVEFTYYLAAKKAGIDMMESKLVDERHFATKRFDRQEGGKLHCLTATGLTGWDFKDPQKSNYENLFDLAIYLRVPHVELEQLFRRMVFNVVFANHDDHLKNHSFVYNRSQHSWHLAPAYDLTYSLNPLLNFTKTARALSINGKRIDIQLTDLKYMAKKYTIKNHLDVVEEVQASSHFWEAMAREQGVPEKIVESIANDFQRLL